MKKFLLVFVAVMALSSCNYHMPEEDWALIYPEMNANLKYLCIDEDGLFDEFDDPLGLGETYIEYLPEALQILDAYVEDELDSYQDLAYLPDLGDRMEGDYVDVFAQQLLGVSPAKACMTIVCDYVREKFNEQDDFSLSYPEFCNIYIDGDDLTYYTTYCADTGEYYVVTYNEFTGELSYILEAVDPEELSYL